MLGRPIHTLLFDFGGTIDADGLAWKERFHACYQAEGLDMAEDAFAPVFYAADDPLVGATGAELGLAETVTRLVANLESGLGADAARGRRVATAFMDETGSTLQRNRPVLKALAERYRLGIVSNFYGNLPAVCRGAEIDSLFGVIVDSEVVGARKPDPAIFQAALGPLRAAADGAVMVGDSLHRDREGARQAGMGFVWIATDGAQQARAGREGAADHPTVSSFDQLADLLL